ncbi:hypothetical protein [Fibrobacter sp.]|uniref:hypothetical protein n=1 Tax=Fibrobacter sp. TaxID=35828 RepID=UPI00260D028E|nr:hypothetical protein [Fibrobacter sp.]MDD5943587.1 hypothetical protein [Fibrobacter sp.]
MMKTVKYLSTMLLAMAAGAAAQSPASLPPPENPATGIWIQQVGDIVPHAATKATLYYTKYEENDRVKSISYQYDGAGYLLMKPSDKKTLCTMGDGLVGADGIVHHPDGDLLIAGQNREIHKVNKTAKDSSKQCLVKTSYPKQYTNGFWHLMMDPNQKWLWAAGIPGYLFRYSTKIDPSVGNFASNGYKVTLRPKSTNRRQDDKLSTVIWDGDGTAFFTYSDYAGGGCEAGGGYAACDSSARKASSANAYFGMFTDTTWTKVTRENQANIGGEIGESVITSVGTKILIDSLEGAHGGAYDTYSKTIFVFGGSRIVQIQPYKDMAGNQQAKVVAMIDLREFFFTETRANMTGPRTPGVGWRLDQGTTDGYGHLFVASNTGHMIFVDYAANPKKQINDNVLVHVQWIDNYLDDLAPLSGVGVIRVGGNTGEDEISSASQSSSSLVEYQESSSSAKSSSSTGNGGSSNSTGNSSGSNGGSSNSTGDSSGSNGGSSNSTGDSSGSNGGSSNSTGSSSGSNGGSSNSTGNSSGSNGGSSNSTGNSSDSNGGNGNSSSSKGNGNGEDVDNPSSSSRFHGSGDDVDVRSSSSRMYYGADDVDYGDDSGLDNYPSADDFEKGDSLVKKTVVMEPTDPDPNNPKIVVIAGNSYLLTDDPKGIPMDLRFDSGLDSAKVGDIIAITLDPDKVKEYFGTADSLTLVPGQNVKLVDPSNGKITDKLVVNADGSVTIFVTANQVVNGGTIKVYGGGEMVIIDNINFYDPIPDSRMGYIKDSDDDMAFDYLEILLKDTLPDSYYLDGVKLVVGGKTYDCVNPTIKGDRIQVDVSGLNLPGVGEFPKDAKALISYADKAGTGATYLREAPVTEVGSNVIKDAYAIRNANGLDSLFLQFNIDLMPVDVNSPDMLVMLKQEGARYGLDEVLKVYMPAKDIVILVGKTFKLKGAFKDSVSLYPSVTFESLPNITSDEYEREVAVKVVERFPSSKNVEYWDTDGDGVLDRIVAVFDRKLTQADIDSTLYMSFPWYSYRGMMIQLQAQPADLKLDPNDSTRVIWEVVSPTRLAEGVTSISDNLPQANVYTYYKVFDETFVNEESAPLVDKMSPVVASAMLSYGKKADTLLVVFSEAINHKNLKSNDYFSYIHGEETIELNPTRIDWSPDGLSAKLVFNGSQGTIMPGDSLVVRKGLKDAIKDNYGNIAGENPQSVIIGGLLNHLVEATNMGSFDANDDRIVDEDSNKTYTLQTVSSVNLRYVPGTTTKEDMEKEGALGQLVQLGERFVPQLLDRAQVSSDGSYDPSVLDSLKPEDVYISFIVNYFDHLGQYVNDTVITVPCNSPKFGGNCLETDKKVFVNWNFKDHKGRFVGTGIYNVQFKMIVRYENRKIEEQIKDKWGVRRKKHKK